MTDTTVCNVPIYEVSAPEYISPVADKVFFEDGETLQYKYDQNTVVKVQKNVTVNMIEDLTPSCSFQRHPDMTYSLTVNIPKHVTARLFDPTRKYPKPFASSPTVFDANGEMQEPEIQNSDTTIARALYKVTESYSLEPVTESVEIGDYLLVFSLKDLEFESWSDGTRDSVIIPYRINVPILYYTTEIPQLVPSIDYTGSVINCKWEEPVPSKYIITGDTSATEVGTHTVIVSVPEGKHFEDSTDTSVIRTWNIIAKIRKVPVPALVQTTFDHTGEDISVSYNVDVTGYKITGTTHATEAGEYVISIQPPDNCVFDGYEDFNIVELHWTIVAIPEVILPSKLHIVDPITGKIDTDFSIKPMKYKDVAPDRYDSSDDEIADAFLIPVPIICEYTPAVYAYISDPRNGISLMSSWVEAYESEDAFARQDDSYSDIYYITSTGFWVKFNQPQQGFLMARALNNAEEAMQYHLNIPLTELQKIDFPCYYTCSNAILFYNQDVVDEMSGSELVIVATNVEVVGEQSYKVASLPVKVTIL